MEKKYALFVVLMTLMGSLNYVLALLSVKVSQKNVLQKSGTTIWVDCTANPKDGTNIKWEKDGEPIHLLPASKKELGDSFVLYNNTLKLIKLKRRQAGTYKCIATSGSETRVEIITIEIAYIQQLEKLEDAAVFVGEQINIPCVEPLGNPAPVLKWLKNNNNFSDLRIDQSGWTLKIKSAKLSDTANYTCVAMGIKNRNDTAELIVYKEGSPVATPKNADVIEEKSAQFVCVSHTDPPLPVIWKKTDTVCVNGVCKVSEQDIKYRANKYNVSGGILSIMNISPADEGNYSCVQALGSQYESVQVTLNVIELIKVRFTKKEEDIEMYRTKVAKVKCQFRGDNPESVQWIKEDTGSLPLHMSVENYTLVINTPQLNDTGNYVCTVKGPHNTENGTQKLVINTTPSFTLRPKNITGRIGETVWVYARGIGNPTPRVIYWRSRKGGENLNKTHYIQFKNGSMKIPGLRKEDSGSYICWLKHNYGSVSSDFTITVLEPEEQEKSSSPMHRTIGIAVGCAGVYILLVIGLMIYCRARRARLLKGIVTEVDGEGNVKDPLVGNEAIPLETRRSLDQWEFSRESIEEIETLGHGKMGRVFKANAVCIKPDEKKTLVAVKEFQTEEKDHKDEYNLEVEMFTQLSHDNVVRLLGVTTVGSPWYLITDYGEEGDLKQYLHRNKELDVSDRLGISICIANGMDYLVKQRYIHRDLAARNCVVKSNKSVMISFLSLCEDLYQNDYYCLNDVPVPLRWLSPEAIQSEHYSEKSDVWSYGVTVWEVFNSGEQPYADLDNNKVLEGICKDVRLSIPSDCPKPLFGILEKCWDVDPEIRPSFVELTAMITDVQL